MTPPTMTTLHLVHISKVVVRYAKGYEQVNWKLILIQTRQIKIETCKAQK